VLTRDDLQTNILTLLHKAGALLPRGLLDGSTLFAGWKAALDLSHEDMSSRDGVNERKRSIVGAYATVISLAAPSLSLSPPSVQ
jgi:hypothetical protein